MSLPLNKIHHGDCLDLMQHLPSGSVDMILCDLPYGTTACKWDTIIPFDKLWAQYERVIKPNGAIVLTASQPFTSALVMSNPKMFRHEWIWLKNRGSNFANTVREPFKEHEAVLLFSAGKWTYNKQMQQRTREKGSLVGTALKCAGQSENYGQTTAYKIEALPEMRVPSSWQKFNTEVGLHPTQKPVALFEYLIRTYTNPGEVVLDNCAGSGTTAVAAENTGRRWICMEQEEKYVTIARARVANLQPMLAL